MEVRGSWNQRKDEADTGHKPVQLNIAVKVLKSICKIIIKINNNTIKGTGFFMNISNSLKYLITNYHVINPDIINGYIEIEIHNHKKMILNINNRDIHYIEKPKDITIIEIKNTDNIYNDIEFLSYDMNYQNGYLIYKNIDIFTIEHPNGDDASFASGKIINIYDYEFDHNITTDNGSSGCPIILNNNNINLIQVIGIHKNGDKNLGINGGTFIGEIFNKFNFNIKNNLNYCINLNNDENNFIIATINIIKKDINKEIRIINSSEEYMRKEYPNFTLKEEWSNEKEIKECEIKINDEIIPFNYYYKFNSKGKYTIKYFFKNYLTKTNHIFYGCSSLSNIDLSNFNTQNVTDMESMFEGCSSLSNINLSNFNTQNVTNMGFMFKGCSSLSNIDLSNFNTQKVTNMRCMFNRCSSLSNIDLSNFKTQNVKYMYGMFYGCSSLHYINISNFKTQKVSDMRNMFKGCSSLLSIDLSNFKTQNVGDMGYMFAECSSLLNINLSNFKTKNATDMGGMFYGCSSLKKRNVIANDKKLISQLKKDNIN